MLELRTRALPAGLPEWQQGSIREGSTANDACLDFVAANSSARTTPQQWRSFYPSNFGQKGYGKGKGKKGKGRLQESGTQGWWGEGKRRGESRDLTSSSHR